MQAKRVKAYISAEARLQGHGKAGRIKQSPSIVQEKDLITLDWKLPILCDHA